MSSNTMVQYQGLWHRNHSFSITLFSKMHSIDQKCPTRDIYRSIELLLSHSLFF